MLVSKLRRSVRRATRSPFLPGASHSPLVVHCCHHKTGTVWFKRVLLAVAENYGLRFHSGNQNDLGKCEVFVQDHSIIDSDKLPLFRGSHMIRDPRDIIISGYFYHLRTTEEWARVPDEEYGGISYQDHLKKLDKEQGLLAEIKRFSKTGLLEMTSWDYADSRFIELRYEDFIGDEDKGFESMFTHYGFSPKGVDKCVSIAKRFSIEKVRAKTDHIRSGQPGEWSQIFSERHRNAFKELTNDLALRLGYASDSNW